MQFTIYIMQYTYLILHTVKVRSVCLCQNGRLQIKNEYSLCENEEARIKIYLLVTL